VSVSEQSASLALDGGVPAGQRIRRLRSNATRFVRRQPLGAAGLLVIVVIGFCAIFAPVLNTSDPERITGDVLLSPGGDHWFGTNRNGVDMWSRVLYGARPSLIIGIVAVIAGLGGGVIIGLASGYLGGFLDFGVSRVVEFVISFPPIIVGIIVAAALRPGLTSVIIAITIVVMASTARIIRGTVLQERESMYVEAARVVGAPWYRVVFRHVLPNTLPLAVVLASALLPAAILFEAGLTFLGFGLAQGQPSWGADLGGTNRTYFTVAPWLAIFPGLALSLTILAFNLLGDSLRDVLDPRLRGSGL
jgi:ABC-type dipeptide/oligopeptide/nickel transport system permease subunit